MIELFCGKIGGGKTLSAVDRMVKYLGNGGTVCTNITLNIEELSKYLKYRYNWIFQPQQYFYLSENQIYEFYKYTPEGTKELPSLIIIDEAHLYFNARTWNKLSMDLITFITQSRKCFTDIIFITQSENTLDKQLRLQAIYVWRFRDLQGYTMPIIKLKYPFPHILERQYSMDTVQKLPLKTRCKLKDKNLYPIYNTVELLREFPRLKKTTVKKIESNRKISAYEKKRICFILLLFFLVFIPKIYKYFKKNDIEAIEIVNDKYIIPEKESKPYTEIEQNINIIGFCKTNNKKFLQLEKELIFLGQFWKNGQIIFMDKNSFILKKENQLILYKGSNNGKIKYKNGKYRLSTDTVGKRKTINKRKEKIRVISNEKKANVLLFQTSKKSNSLSTR